MFDCEIAAIRIWSNARVKKAAKVLANAMVRFLAAQPRATLTYSTYTNTNPSLEQVMPHDSPIHFIFTDSPCSAQQCNTLYSVLDGPV